jgi:hypothetical protein
MCQQEMFFFLHLTERFVFHKTFFQIADEHWVLTFDFIHPVTSGTKMINFTLNKIPKTPIAWYCASFQKNKCSKASPHKTV